MTGGAGDATPSETEPIKRYTRQQGLFTNNFFLAPLLLPTNQPTQPTSLFPSYHTMALPQGLINTCKFITYNRDKITRAERQNLETRSDGLGTYLTPAEVWSLPFTSLWLMTWIVVLANVVNEQRACSSWVVGCTLDNILWHQALMTLRHLDSDLCPKRRELPADQWVMYKPLHHGIVNPRARHQAFDVSTQVM